GPAPTDRLPHRGHAAVGDAVAMGQLMTTRMSPVPTVSPGETRISETVPAFSALTWFSIFIASRTTTGWPTSTESPTATSALTIVPCIGAATSPLPAAPVPPPAAERGLRALAPAAGAPPAGTAGASGS